MSPSGIDYFAQLVRKVAGSARQLESQGLLGLAEALTRLPPGSHQRAAYNSVMDHAAALKLGAYVEDLEEEHVEDYRLGDPETDGPKLFLENLILDIDNSIDDAEVGANEEGGDDLTEEADDLVNGRGNEIAREIAGKRALEGARVAAEEAYKLAYQWAYEDLYHEAYQQALNELVAPSDIQV